MRPHLLTPPLPDFMTQTATEHVLRDRQVDVETPEHVAIGYDLADLGSRFTALLIDGLIIIAGSLGLGIIYGMVGGRETLGSGLGMALVVAGFFLLFWGYFLFFEGLRDGQTPGKRRMGIRVVADGGFPVTVRAAAIRNLLRLVDIQPAPSWLLGGLVMMLHPQTKRLGDLAAGTVVVRDRSREPIPEEASAAPGVSLGPPRLSAEEFTAVAMFVSRERDLAREVRARLAGTLYPRVVAAVGEEARRGYMAPADYLVAVHAEEAARRQAAGAGGRAGSAQATRLLRRQKPEWDEYAALLETARRHGLNHLGERRVSRFATLYREIAADLARARTYGGSRELVYSLERLVGSGHNLLYRPPVRSWRRFHHWIVAGFPALVRRRWVPVALAAALFYGPALVSFAAVRADPPLAREMMPAVMIARAEEAPAKQARGEGYVEMPEVHMPALASELISNNVQVTFAAFAGGIAAGLGSVFILVLNGVHLGSAAALFANHQASLHLWTFVAPHGVIELTAICIAGGAGLWMGSALLLPGRRTRREVLVERAREAVSLIAGTTILLVVAGFIEGFISPSALPAEVKFAFAGLFAVLLVAYLALGGRGEEDAAEAMARAR
jgi:uncharacterized membrane protein SpoIIM required for sporulation/uncharacterized RDD family membrane protein YckC